MIDNTAKLTKFGVLLKLKTLITVRGTITLLVKAYSAISCNSINTLQGC